MQFYVGSNVSEEYQRSSFVLLEPDNWDDFGFKTLFTLVIVSPGSHQPRREVGPIKILAQDMDETRRALPSRFTTLPRKRFCSLGSNPEYYEALRQLEDRERNAILSGLNDIVAYPHRSEWRHKHRGLTASLIRFSDAISALEEGPRILGLSMATEQPGALTFRFRTRLTNADADHELNFHFDGLAALPRRLAVVVGANGTGKTTVLRNLAACLGGWGITSDGEELLPEQIGSFTPHRPAIRTVIAVSFSAFDDFQRPRHDLSILAKSSVSYRYVGNRAANDDRLMLSPEQLCLALLTYRDHIEDGSALDGRLPRTRLELFSHMLTQLVGSDISQRICKTSKRRLGNIWRGLSSGQRIVVLTAAGIIASIERRSVILLDEPETHLHPGLLGRMMAVISDVLNVFDAFAILATHHPYVVQLVPSDGVQVLVRQENRTLTLRPSYQTFGADLGTLLESTLGLAEPDADWRDMLDKSRLLLDEDTVAQEFDPPLGFPALAYLRSRRAEEEST